MTDSLSRLSFSIISNNKPNKLSNYFVERIGHKYNSICLVEGIRQKYPHAGKTCKPLLWQRVLIWLFLLINGLKI